MIVLGHVVPTPLLSDAAGRRSRDGRSRKKLPQRPAKRLRGRQAAGPERLQGAAGRGGGQASHADGGGEEVLGVIAACGFASREAASGGSLKEYNHDGTSPKRAARRANSSPVNR